MREYYYLTGLADSPYDLTLTDALHLGAARLLPVYAAIGFSVELLELEENKRFEDAHICLKVFPETLSLFEKKVIHQRATGQPETFINSEILDTAIVDEKYKGTIPANIPFDALSTAKRVVVHCTDPSLPEHPDVSIHDLVCWADDLESLADKGRIKRRTDAPPTENTSAKSQEYPPHLEALTIAWRKFWKNADPTDRTACPRKPDVVAWLVEQGFSAKNADAGATIIKPQWAIEKGW